MAVNLAAIERAAKEVLPEAHSFGVSSKDGKQVTFRVGQEAKWGEVPNIDLKKMMSLQRRLGAKSTHAPVATVPSDKGLMGIRVVVVNFR